MNERFDVASEWNPIEGVAYFDTAAHAVMPKSVVAAVAATLEANRFPHRVDDATFFDVSNALRGSLGQLIGGSPREIALTTGASTGLQALAHGLSWERGDGIVIAAGDFPLQYAVWKPMEARVGATLTMIAPRDGEIAVDDVLSAINERTRVVSLSHVRFDTGALLDAARIAAACRDAGAWFVLDSSQSFGAVPTDVRALGVDAVVCAGYKWLLGPYGTGFLWVKQSRLDELPPGPFYWTGQDASDMASIRFERPEPSRDAKRLDAAESATAFNLNLGAFRASVDLVARIDPAVVLRHGQDLIDALYERLPAHCVPASPRDRARRGVYGSFTAGSLEQTRALYQRLREGNVFTSLRQGKIRVAPHLFNTVQHIEQLVKEVERSVA
jgi:cysteine desulfurase/selenocysteine lyase